MKEHHPELFEMAKEYEKKVGDKQFSWVEGKTLDEIANSPRREIQEMDEVEGCAICHL